MNAALVGASTGPLGRALGLLLVAGLAWALALALTRTSSSATSAFGPRPPAASLPRGWPVLPRDLRAVHPASYDGAVRGARQFAATFALTFSPDATGDAQGPRLVRELFAARARVLRDLHELRMRLPNDLEQEKLAVQAIEDQDHAMHDHIEDAKERCGVPGLHPGPVDGLYYNRWYRASNDDIR